MASSSYELGRQVALEKEAAIPGSIAGLRHLLRRIARQAKVGFGRKTQEMQSAANPVGSSVNQMKSMFQNRRFISPTEKLHRKQNLGGFARGAGAFAAEHPGVAALGSGLTAAQLNDFLVNAGQGSAINNLYEQQA